MTTPKQKLTPEQKAEKKALKKQQQADAQAAYDAERATMLAAYKAELPKRLMAAIALAGKASVCADVSLSETGPSVRFYISLVDQYFDKTITYESEEWEIEFVEYTLSTILKERDESTKRKACAQSAWNNLEEDQKSCIKEFIHYLK
jgi:hypothetical protein